MPVKLSRIFPLPGIVLFPGMLLPLRVYEPRYVQLLERSLADNREVVMANISPDQLTRIEGNPTVYGVAGAGDIVHCEQLTDGTYRTVLEGQERRQLLNELPMNGLVREFDSRTLVDINVNQDELESYVVLLKERIRTWIHKRLPDSVHETVWERLEEAPSKGNLLDRMAALVIHTPDHRQALIESPDVVRRARILENLTRWAGSTGPFGLTTMN